MKVRDFCSRNVVTAEPGASLREASLAMRNAHVGALVVVERQQGVARPVGILTDRDIVVAVIAVPGARPEGIRVGDAMADKAVAILLPISAFVAAGFEHSVANMYFIPLGMMLQAAGGQPVELFGLARNLVPVIAGNLVGGSVLVALVYYVIYRWPLRSASTLAPSRKASDG